MIKELRLCSAAFSELSGKEVDEGIDLFEFLDDDQEFLGLWLVGPFN